MTTKELIRAEIERREKILTNVYEEQFKRKDEEMMNYYHGKVVALEELLTFLDTIEEPVSDDLEEAAREIVIKMHPCMKDCTILGDRLTRGQLMALVKAGAKWQKKNIIALIQSRLSEIIGDAQPKPALRAEVQDLIEKIKKDEK